MTVPFTPAEIAARRAEFDADVRDMEADRLDAFDAAFPTGSPPATRLTPGVAVQTLPDIAIQTGPPWPLLIAGAVLTYMLFFAKDGGRGEW